VGRTGIECAVLDAGGQDAADELMFI